MDSISITESPRREGGRRGSAKASEGLNHIAVLVISALVFLLPLFSLPSSPFLSLVQMKGIFISFALSLALIFWLLSRLRRGAVGIPFTYLFLWFAFIPTVYVVGAFFAPSLQNALVGQGFEFGTVLTIIIFFSLATLISLVFKKRLSTLRMYGALYTAFVVLFVYHVARVFLGPDFLSFGIFTTSTSSPIGSWNDLALFSALIALISLIALEILSLERILNIFLYMIFSASLLVIALVNFDQVWIMLAVFSFLFLIFVFLSRSDKGEEGKQSLPYLTIFLLALSIVAAFAHAPIGAFISDTLDISHVQVRPSWESTIGVIKGSLEENMILGSGPNTFHLQWMKYRPLDVNLSPFWNLEFGTGIGYLPSQIATTGVLGFVAWTSFLVTFFFFGLRLVIRVLEHDPIYQFASLASVTASFFLWSVLIFYTPTLPLTMLTAVFTGAVIALSVYLKDVKMVGIQFSTGWRKKFIAGLGIVIFLVFISVDYIVAERVLALKNFRDSVVLAQTGNYEEAGAALEHAIDHYPLDLYYRSLVQAKLQQLRTLLASESADTDLEEKFQTLLTSAIENGRLAVTSNPAYYENWRTLGEIYHSIVLLNLEGAAENAHTNYDQAIMRNPMSPALHLSKAQLYADSGNLENARREVNAALELKDNYADAYLFLARFALAEGNVEGAAGFMEYAVLSSPSNPALFYELGVLLYGLEDYDQARAAFERAVLLVPTYANAKYFLGLSYERLGRIEEAIVQFEDVETLNPNHEGIRTILETLREEGTLFLDEEVPDEEIEEESTEEVIGE